MKIDKNYDKPIHEQLEELIIERIQNEELKPYEKIESENSVAKTYSISRSTVRAVYDRLVLKNILTRRAGKGTFVSMPVLNVDMSLLMGFSKTLRDRGIKVATKLLSRQIISPNVEIQNKLKLKKDAQVIEIKRVRCLKNMPFVLHIAYLPLERCQAVMEADLESKGLTSYLENELWLKINKSEQTILAAISGPQEVNHLQINQGDPILIVRGISYVFNERPIRHSISIYRADISRLEITSEKPVKDVST